MSRITTEDKLARSKVTIKKQRKAIAELKAMVEKLADYVNTANEIIAESSDYDDSDHEDAHGLVNDARKLIGMPALDNPMEDRYLHNQDEDEEE